MVIPESQLEPQPVTFAHNCQAVLGTDRLGTLARIYSLKGTVVATFSGEAVSSIWMASLTQ